MADAERRFEIHAANVVGDVVRTLNGERLHLGERITVVPESRATTAEAERDRLREALERIAALENSCPVVVAVRIARSALTTGTDDG